MVWQYKTETVLGNMIAAAAWLTKHHPEWDVVTLSFTGNYTIVVYRLPMLTLEQKSEPAALTEATGS